MAHEAAELEFEGELLPAGQGVQDTVGDLGSTGPLNVPSGQGAHVALRCEKDPGGHETARGYRATTSIETLSAGETRVKTSELSAPIAGSLSSEVTASAME